REVSPHGAQQADQEENGSDDDMEAVEAGRHEEGRAVDRLRELERRMDVLISLHKGEQDAEQHSEHKAPDQSLPVVLQKGVVGPGDSGAGEQQNDRVVERQVEGIENLDSLRWPL